MQEITLAERLEHGGLRIDELATLMGCCRSTITKDIALGKLDVVKVGAGKQGRVLIKGPSARAYMEGAK